jgi:hypothetical protein
MSRLTVVLSCGRKDPARLAAPFIESSLVEKVLVLAAGSTSSATGRVETIPTDRPASGSAFRQVFERVQTDYVLFVDADTEVRLGQFALERLLDIADQTNAGLVYADHWVCCDGTTADKPLADWQLGSIRDDFAFGPLRLISTGAARQAFEAHGPVADVQWAGRYDLRLKLSVKHPIVRLPEFMYTVLESKDSAAGNAHFAYVDPKNAAVQKEMEQVATEHLRRIGAYLEPVFEPIPPSNTQFEVEASVVIPVRNRERTIADAVNSVLSQKTSFSFNLLVVDNHSTDKTTAILREIASRDPRLVHITPERLDLGIGGCWNEAVFSPRCGKYAVQLDSDDLYAGPDTLERIVAAFRRGPYAAVIGSYKVVDFNLKDLPPGLIDHREWTRENGRNNALRINGLGAPRAFMTELLRQSPFPNVSYGEDYGVAIRFSRRYEIGRIYDCLYLCRRWEDNTDAALPVTKVNQYNTYKDRLRTIEVLARRQMNANR